MTPTKYKIVLVTLVIAFLQFHALSGQAKEVKPATPIHSISNLYSDTELKLKLAIKPNSQSCEDALCLAKRAEFDNKIALLGLALEKNAFALNPGLEKRIPGFEFIVSDKQELATTSNASGKIVLFRNLQSLELSDEALRFLIAREMGHVIAKHHDKNIATKLIISAVASAIFPAVAIISASSAAQQASTATTLVTSAASTATSVVGSEVALYKMKPNQITEADEIALTLVENADWDIAQVAASLQQVITTNQPSAASRWLDDLKMTTATLEKKIVRFSEIAHKQEAP